MRPYCACAGFHAIWCLALKALKIPLIVLLVAAGIAALGWFSGGYSKLLVSIMPAAGAKWSPSLEPYDLAFEIDRQAPRSLNSDRPPPQRLVWKLTLPRAFVFQETGDNSTVFDSHENLHAVYLFATYDSAKGAFSPGFLADRAMQPVEGFVVRLANGPGIRVAQAVRDEDLAKLPRDQTIVTSPCSPDEGIARCNVHISFHGWPVTIMMPKKYYFGDYKRYSDLLEEFLNSKTTSISDRTINSDEGN